MSTLVNTIRYTLEKIEFTNRVLITARALRLALIIWWRDVSREAESGQHNKHTYSGIQIGIIMLIASEVLFFFGFFWSYFWYAIQLQISSGLSWPPTGVICFNPYGVPLLNRLILLSSGATVTWAHHEMNKNHKEVLKGLFITIYLGVLFSILQAYEYMNRLFSISDASYGAVFFIITGFHGAHVIAGTIILTVSIKRILKGSLNKRRHNNLLLSIWYWHFVDVVWLILYLFVYWWTAL